MIEVEDNTIKIIDQRKLPHKEEYFICKNYNDVFYAIKNMVVRGAPAISVVAAYGIAISNNKEKTIEVISKSRPTAIDLFNAINFMKKEPTMERAIEWHNKIKKTTLTICKNGQIVLNGRKNIMVHCNTGRLATMAYGTALGAIIEYGKSNDVMVYVCETRPRFQGAITAWELNKEKIKNTVIVDSAAAYVMKEYNIECICVGADRIMHNGNVANKIGTYGLSILAKEHNIPFYVFAPFSTFHKTNSVEIEERDGKEITTINGERIYSNANVLNPAFDITPKENISKYITEFGVFNNVEDIWKFIEE